jgi:hypothetical protein
MLVGLRMRNLLWILIVALGVFAAGDFARAGTNANSIYTDRGKTDFDTFLKLLEPYGKWTKIDGKWAFTPNDHAEPYRNGRWIYTEFGWYWRGNTAHSWATEHYGFWKRGADKVWSWYPGPYWLPQIVEFRATNLYIGWRTGEVDSEGNFTESPIERFSKPEEWTFVTLEHFANPITPAVIAKTDVTKAALEDSTECRHTYMTYRIIDRPGPHPADFADLCKDGGMLSPLAMRDTAAAQPAPKPDPNSPAAKMTGVTPLKLMSDVSDVDPSADKRKVQYWVTMSLPKPDAQPPPDAKADEIYLYRPDLFQDQDGIERRITLFLDPKARVRLKDLLGSTPLNSGSAPTPSAPAVPAAPAVDPFHNPLDDSFKGPKGGSAPTNQASKPAATNSAPSGLKN